MLRATEYGGRGRIGGAGALLLIVCSCLGCGGELLRILVSRRRGRAAVVCMYTCSRPVMGVVVCPTKEGREERVGIYGMEWWDGRWFKQVKGIDRHSLKMLWYWGPVKVVPCLGWTPKCRGATPLKLRLR